MKEFKVGDKVRIVKRVDRENGWNNIWTPLMNEYIGKEYTISFIGQSGVFFKEDGIFRFPPSSLEPVDPFKKLKEAYAAGKKIEFDTNYIGWQVMDWKPSWNAPVERYRIKSTKKYLKIPMDAIIEFNTSVNFGCESTSVLAFKGTMFDYTVEE